MSGSRWWTRCGVAVLAVVVLAGCGSSATESPSTASTPAPSASELVSRASAAMSSVTSAHFALAVTGTVPDLQVQSADGDLTQAGSAQGKASIVQLGQLIEVEFVVVDKDLYLKAATGGFTKLPAALAANVYDPTVILQPDAGVAKVLTSAGSLSQVTESNGTYSVSGTVPKAVAASLTPGVTTDPVGTFVIDAATSRPTSISFALTGSDGAPASVQLSLSDFNKQLTITAPSGS